MTEPLILTGATIAGATTTSFLAQILAVDPPNESRVAIPSSHLGTTGRHTHIPGKLVEPGECRVTIHHDPTLEPPIDLVPEVWTITYPNSGATTKQFTGFFTNYEPTGELEGKMTARVTIKISGDITTA
jgi:hypothetical protein